MDGLVLLCDEEKTTKLFHSEEKRASSEDGRSARVQGGLATAGKAWKDRVWVLYWLNHLVALTHHCCGWVACQKWRSFQTLLYLSPVRQDESAQVALNCELVGCFPSGKEQAGAGIRGGREAQPIGREAAYSPNGWAGGRGGWGGVRQLRLAMG